MKVTITTTKEIEIPVPTLQLNNRKNSLEYLVKDGKPNYFARRDIAVVQFWDIANVFINPDMTVQVDTWQGVSSNSELEQELARLAKDFFIANAPNTYLQEQQEFLRSLGFVIKTL